VTALRILHNKTSILRISNWFSPVILMGQIFHCGIITTFFKILLLVWSSNTLCVTRATHTKLWIHTRKKLYILSLTQTVGTWNCSLKANVIIYRTRPYCCSAGIGLLMALLFALFCFAYGNWQVPESCTSFYITCCGLLYYLDNLQLKLWV
jgi:hypothetical protein